MQTHEIDIWASKRIFLVFSIGTKPVAKHGLPDIAHQLVSPITYESDEEILVDVVPNKLIFLAADPLPQNYLAAFALFLALFFFCENL